MTTSAETRAAMDAFLAAYLEDVKAGRSLPLDEYRLRFPGQEAAVEAAWREVHDGCAPELTGAPGGFAAIGGYEIVRELGRGGQGVVYLARDTRLRRDVALKVFPRSLASPHVALRIRREAEALSRIEDRGICSIYDFGETEHEAFIAMRYVRGRTLAEELRDHGPGASSTTSGAAARVRRILRIIEHVARAISKAHAVGIVHRDLKPGNIMIDGDDQPVILDFGLARDDASETPTLTRTGDMLGTPAYMAPEQISGKMREADARGDVYSLGVCLYECLTLRRPFAAPTRDELLRRILSEEPTDPRRIDRRIPRDVAAVTAVAMAKEPRSRYATALDFAEDLRRAQADEPILARRPGIVGRTLRYVRRRPLQSGLAATAIVAAVLGGTLAFRWKDLRAEGERRRAAAVEAALEAALDSVASEDAAEAALARLDEVEGAGFASVDATVARALSLLRIGQGPKALAILDAGRDRESSEPALRWARWWALRQMKRPEARAYRESLGEPTDAMAVFIAGLDARDNFQHRDPAITPELDRLHRLVLGAPAPRRAFHLLLTGLAAEAGETSIAIAVADAMLRLWPEATSSWTAMGYACQQSDPVRAIRCFRKAIELGARPGAGVAVLLANTYSAAGDEEESARVYREALADAGGFTKENRALALHNLANSEYQVCDFEASVANNRLGLATIAERPGRLSAQLLCNLAQSQIHTDGYAEALAALERGHAMGQSLPGWPFNSAGWIETMQLHLRLAERVGALGSQEAPPDEDATPAQWAAAAEIGGSHATAARWFRQIHGPDAKIPPGEVPRWSQRYLAVAAALRAAEGEGRDAASTDPAARVALRELALSWWGDELQSVREALEGKQTTPADALRSLQRFSHGSGVVSLRDQTVVRRWPEAQRDRLRRLWTEWEGLVARVRPAY